ncbi:ribonuclease activity regulator RraA [Rhodophyticola sp. CCM32]|uniref:ribonuclease activity regulator RraA n=1 Tax=Rhodophyticola sp. CCM32 TaxID=2916397 RepID=UPI00107F6840|nr:ribonuclease activity regulator RraA [Rhodophyticola sp. CCM32]QBY01219.1 ribonuclease activity regulator RraA [Rhodophyticola sp. CCM32]
MKIPTISRPSKDLVEGLAKVGAATLSGSLFHMGVRNSHIRGPVAMNTGRTMAGPLLTLQYLPKREDLHTRGEYDDVEDQLHRHVLYQVEEGDVVIVDARGNMNSGIFGDMMLTYLEGRGGAGIVVDGCIRDSRNARKRDLGIWVRGSTPNFDTQTELVAAAVNVPIGCGGVYVVPGDIVVADDDGAVLVPIAMAEAALDHASAHDEWEEFSRLRLSQGGDLRKYYPLSEGAQPEYQAWRAEKDTSVR